jgi:hypothetical protein
MWRALAVTKQTVGVMVVEMIDRQCERSGSGVWLVSGICTHFLAVFLPAPSHTRAEQMTWSPFLGGPVDSQWTVCRLGSQFAEPGGAGKSVVQHKSSLALLSNFITHHKHSAHRSPTLTSYRNIAMNKSPAAISSGRERQRNATNRVLCMQRRWLNAGTSPLSPGARNSDCQRTYPTTHLTHKVKTSSTRKVVTSRIAGHERKIVSVSSIEPS